MPMLDYYNCVRLLERLVELDVIQRDPENKDNILVYRDAAEIDPSDRYAPNWPEGWYSENLMSIASELTSDEEGQNYLLDAYQKRAGKPFERTTF